VTDPSDRSPARDLPRSLLLIGLAGSLLVAVGGTGSGALPRPAPGSWLGVSALTQSPATRTVSLWLVIAGVVLLAGAWWRARHALDGVAPRAVTRAAALWSLPLVAAPPMFTRDVYAYGAQAAIAARGYDPYALGPIEGGGAFSAHVDLVWRGEPSPYGPAFLAPASWLVRLTGGSVETSALGLRLLAVLGLVLVAWALPRLARRTGVPVPWALWLGLANPLVLLHAVAGAHNDALMVGLMVAGLAVGLGGRGQAGRLLLAGALVALGTLVKAPALAALPVLVLAVAGWRARARAAALAGAGALVVAAVLPVGTGLGWGWLSALDTSRAVLSLFSPMTGLGTVLGAGADAVGLVDGTAAVRDPVLSAAAAVAALAAGGLLLLTGRLGPVRALGLALLAVVALSPTVLPWYLLWGVVPLAAACGRRTAVGLGAGCLVLCFTVWPNGGSVVRPPLYGLPLLAASAVAVVAARREQESADRLSAPHR
jgi:alpha-1,6-mannosyltransferase